MITRLGRDERGAIALLAVFMAIFLIAVVAYVQGIGAAVLQREQMQDAADAAAFSSAVLHARGMNVLALLNMLMAALLAVLVALKLVEMLTGIAIVAISVIAFFLPGAATLIPPISQLRSGVIEAHETLSPGIHTALEAMHVAATGVRTLVPVVSQASAFEIVASQPDSPAQLGFAVPMRATLPTEDGTFAQICGEAGDYVGKLTRWGLESLHLGGEIGDIVAGATSDLVQSGGDWFCGDEGGSPPKTTVEQRHTFPQLPQRADCEAIHPDQSGYEADEHARVCDAAERAELDSEPNDDGDCAGPSYADEETIECDDPRHPYHVRAWLARRDCSPEADGDENGKLRDFQYQEHRFTRRYLFEDGRWRVASTAAEEQVTEGWLHQREQKLRPCARRHAPIASPWNDARDAGGERIELPPVCSNVAAPEEDGYEGQLREVTHREVTRVFGCERTVKLHYEVPPSEGGQPADASSEVPQRLVEGAELGAEPFQIRAGVIGELPSERPTRLLELATFPEGDPEPVLAPDALAQLGRIAVAQAEYYYDGPEQADPESYVWSMRWRARLRRFRWPESEGSASVDAEDAGAFSAGAIEVSFDVACAAALAAVGADTTPDPCTLLRDQAAEIVH